jgi:hypothetical protein
MGGPSAPVVELSPAPVLSPVVVVFPVLPLDPAVVLPSEVDADDDAEPETVVMVDDVAEVLVVAELAVVISPPVQPRGMSRRRTTGKVETNLTRIPNPIRMEVCCLGRSSDRAISQASKRRRLEPVPSRSLAERRPPESVRRAKSRR